MEKPTTSYKDMLPVALGELPSTGVLGDRYPVDEEGFAISLDPETEKNRYQEFFQKYGFVVGKQVITSELTTRAIHRIKQIGEQLSNSKFDITNPDTAQNVPRDSEGTPLLSRGFFEIYHDDIWAQIRQSPRLYLHHQLIWQQSRLWVTFDRFGVKPPSHPESKALPLHTDQSPAIHSGFRTIQGILALSPCTEEIGTTVLVPASRTHFDEFKQYTQPNEQYVELSDTSNPLIRKLQDNAQPVPLRAGDIITWDSRVAHANTANKSFSETRFVALVAAGVARDNAELVEARQSYYDSGLGKNIRDAYMHASIRPRYTDEEAIRRIREPEHLSSLGEQLYGFRKYGETTS